MVVLITGASHTGKTLLAQKLLEKYQYPYLSIDHLKMGLIRSEYTDLTPADDEQLTAYLWPIVREMIKTAIENKQNLVIEGCYIPYNWQSDFDEIYLRDIRYVCLIMSESYITENFGMILQYGSVVECRLDDSELSADRLIAENHRNLEMCRKFDHRYILIDKDYCIDLDIIKPRLVLNSPDSSLKRG